MGVESKRVCSCEERVRPNKNNIKMGRGGQEVLKMDDILACKALPLGKSQLQRQAMVREYVVKLAMILLEHISNHGFCVVDNFLGVRLALSSLRRYPLPTRVRGTAGAFVTFATFLTPWWLWLLERRKRTDRRTFCPRSPEGT